MVLVINAEVTRTTVVQFCYQGARSGRHELQAHEIPAVRKTQLCKEDRVF